MNGAQFAKASRIRVPNDMRKVAEGTPGTQEVARVAQNDFGVKKIAITTTHGQEALEYALSGQFVQLLFIGTADGDQCYVAVSDVTGGEVDRAVVAANNSSTPANSVKSGAPVISGQGWINYQLPEWDRGKVAYLIHEGSAAGTLFLNPG